MYHGSKFNVPSTTPAPGFEAIIGFYTTRIVVAENELEAKEKGIDQLLNEEEVRHLISTTQSTSGKEPIIEIESVRRLSWNGHRRQKHAGFAFYSDDEDT